MLFKMVRKGTKGRRLLRRQNDDAILRARKASRDPAHQLKFINPRTKRVAKMREMGI